MHNEECPAADWREGDWFEVSQSHGQINGALHGQMSCAAHSEGSVCFEGICGTGESADLPGPGSVCVTVILQTHVGNAHARMSDGSYMCYHHPRTAYRCAGLPLVAPSPEACARLGHRYTAAGGLMGLLLGKKEVIWSTQYAGLRSCFTTN